MYYESETLYIESAPDMVTRITRLDAVILALEDAALRAAAGEDVTEYWLDDGQTKIKTVRRGSSGIATSILAYERIRERLINKLNGRVFRLSDSKNFTG